MMVNEQVLQGNWNEVKGALRNRWGQLMDNELEMAQGNAEQLVGLIQRKTGESREAIENYLEKVVHEGSGRMAQAADSARRAAQQAKETWEHSSQRAAESMRHGLETATETVRTRPLESVMVCFGVGLLTGIAVGLIMRSR